MTPTPPAEITPRHVYERRDAECPSLLVPASSTGHTLGEEWDYIATTPPLSEAAAVRWYEAYRALGQPGARASEPSPFLRSAERLARKGSTYLWDLAERIGGWK